MYAHHTVTIAMTARTCRLLTAAVPVMRIVAASSIHPSVCHEVGIHVADMNEQLRCYVHPAPADVMSVAMNDRTLPVLADRHSTHAIASLCKHL